jgi:hypothetical protein
LFEVSDVVNKKIIQQILAGSLSQEDRYKEGDSDSSINFEKHIIRTSTPLSEVERMRNKAAAGSSSTGPSSSSNRQQQPQSQSPFASSPERIMIPPSSSAEPSISCPPLAPRSSPLRVSPRRTRVPPSSSSTGPSRLINNGDDLDKDQEEGLNDSGRSSNINLRSDSIHIESSPARPAQRLRASQSVRFSQRLHNDENAARDDVERVPFSYNTRRKAAEKE